MEVTRGGKPARLTVRDFQHLPYLLERAGSTVPRAELPRSMWGYDVGSFAKTG
jgi:DNA-binding response OmpR family regulator